MRVKKCLCVVFTRWEDFNFKYPIYPKSKVFYLLTFLFWFLVHRINTIICGFAVDTPAALLEMLLSHHAAYQRKSQQRGARWRMAAQTNWHKCTTGKGSTCLSRMGTKHLCAKMTTCGSHLCVRPRVNRWILPCNVLSSMEPRMHGEHQWRR